MNRQMHAILDLIERHAALVGSRELSRQLKQHGMDLSERTVRHYMKMLDQRGYTEVFGKEGRRITQLGRDELSHAHVSEKVGFVISKIETLSYLTTLDTDTMEGDVILNVSTFPRRKLPDALRLLKPVFSSPYVMSDRVMLTGSGRRIGDYTVPKNMVGLGTVCSVTLNGVFLKAGIPVTSRFGGIIEINGGDPKRFTSLISYEGSSLDPLEIFIKSGMTDAMDAVKAGSGRVLASFREIPVVCIDRAKELSRRLREKGIQGVLVIGEPNRPLLEVPVGMDKAGIVIVGGLNPVAVLEENGIPTRSKAMSTLCPFNQLQRYQDVAAGKRL